jgi:chromate transport protein ChrA
VIEVVPDTGAFASTLKKEVGEAVEGATEHSSGAFQKMAGIGQAALMGIGTAAVGVGIEAVHLADTFEKAHARLETAVKNSGHNYEDFAKQVSAADKNNEKFGLTADQTEGALARLTQSLNDPKKAMDDLGLVVNIAAARHLDLETAATLVGKVASGNTTILKRYGIDLDVAKGGAQALGKAHDAVTKASEALAVAQEKAGASHTKLAATSDTVKKAQEALQAALDKAGVAHGNAAQMAVNQTKAQDALIAASKAMEAAQQNVVKVQADIASGHIKAADAAAALQKANDASSAASTKFHNLQMAEMAARSVADDKSTAMDEANKKAVQKAQETLAAAVAASHDKMAAAGTKGSEAVQKAQENLTKAQEKLTAVTGASGNAIEALTERFSGNAQSQAETFAGKIAALEAKAKDLGIQLGMILVPIIEKVVSAILDAVNWFEKHKVIAEILGGIIATVLVVAIGAYIASMIAATAATLAAAAPVLAIIAAIGLLAAGVIYAYEHWGAFHDAVQKVVDVVVKIKDAVSDFISGFTKGTDEIGSAQTTWAQWGAVAYEWTMKVWDAVKPVVTFLEDHFKPILLGIAIAVTALVAPWALVAAGLIYAYEKFGLVRDIVDALAHVLVDVLKGAFETTKVLIENTIDSIKFITRVITDLVDIVVDIFTGKWGDAWKHFKDIPAAMIDYVKGILGNFLDWFKTVPMLVIDALGNLLPVLGEAGMDLLKGLWEGAKAMFSQMADWITAIPKAELALLGDLSHLLWDVGGAVISGFIGGLQSQWDNVAGFFAGLVHSIPQWVTNYGGDMGRLILDFGRQVISGFIEGMHSLWGDVAGFFGSLVYSIPHWLTNFGGDMGRLIWDLGQQIVRGFINGLVSLWGDVAGFFGGLVRSIPLWIIDFAGGAGGFLQNAGRLVVGGLIDGMRSMGDAVIDAILDIAGPLAGIVKKVFHIGSPSKVFMEIGQQLVMGLAVGLRDTRPVDAAMGVLVGAVGSGIGIPSVAMTGLGGVGSYPSAGAFSGIGVGSSSTSSSSSVVVQVDIGNVSDLATVQHVQDAVVAGVTYAMEHVNRSTTAKGPNLYG